MADELKYNIVQYSPKMTETSFRKMIREEEREKMLFLGEEGEIS